MHIGLNLTAQGSISIPERGVSPLGVCHLWVIPTLFDQVDVIKGFTTTTNQGVFPLGLIALATPFIDVGSGRGASVENLWANLHSRIVRVVITPTIFVNTGGMAEIVLVLQGGGSNEIDTISFVARDCRGVSEVKDPIAFAGEFVQTPRFRPGF